MIHDILFIADCHRSVSKHVRCTPQRQLSFLMPSQPTSIWPAGDPQVGNKHSNRIRAVMNHVEFNNIWNVLVAALNEHQQNKCHLTRAAPIVYTPCKWFGCAFFLLFNYTRFFMFGNMILLRLLEYIFRVGLLFVIGWVYRRSNILA